MTMNEREQSPRAGHDHTTRLVIVLVAVGIFFFLWLIFRS
jgi:hypothetical protein